MHPGHALPPAFGLNRERAGIGNCCNGCLCYSILGPVLVLIYEYIAFALLMEVPNSQDLEYYAIFSQLLLLLLLSAAEGFNRTKLKLVTDGKAPDVDCGSAKANILAYFGSYVVALLTPSVLRELLPIGSSLYPAISFLSFVFGLWVLAALPAQVRITLPA